MNLQPATPSKLNYDILGRPRVTPDRSTPSEHLGRAHTITAAKTPRPNIATSPFIPIQIGATPIKPTDVPTTLVPKTEPTPAKLTGGPQLAVKVSPRILPQEVSPAPIKSDKPSTESNAAMSTAEIKDMLRDYFKVNKSLWTHLPQGSRICYYRIGEEPAHERFRRGGYLCAIIVIADGSQRMVIESRKGGRPGDRGYYRYSVAVSSIDEIWKLFGGEVFVELYLLQNSLIRKRQEMADVVSMLHSLTARFEILEKNVTQHINECIRQNNIQPGHPCEDTEGPKSNNPSRVHGDR